MLLVSFLGSAAIRPTKHYERHHADVPWDLVVLTVLSPTKWRATPRIGKGRFTYLRMSEKHIIEVHVKEEQDGTIWIINAFRKGR